MDSQLLDNDVFLNESERKIQWAGFWIRVGASLIDGLVLLPLFGLTMLNLYFLKSLPAQFIITLIMAGYKPVMEFKYGATLGKMAVKIKVVNGIYQPLSFIQAVIRYIPWLIGQVISIYGYVILFQHPDFLNAVNWTEIALLQKDLIPPGYNYISSAFLLISALFIAFNTNKQALHDMMANTYCIIHKQS